MMGVLYHLQKGLDHKARFSFSPAPHADDSGGLGYYLPLIQECLGTNRKILHLGSGSKLPGYLSEHDSKSFGLDAADYPPIATLGYALSYLCSCEPVTLRPVKPGFGAGPNSWM
jgi:hypothetical protein